MFTRRFDDTPGTHEWDRRPIRLDPSLSQEGIAATLRRAFGETHAPTASDRDFDDLLAQLR